MLTTTLLLAALAATVPDAVAADHAHDGVADEAPPTVTIPDSLTAEVDDPTQEKSTEQPLDRHRSLVASTTRAVQAPSTTISLVGKAAPVIDRAPPVVTIVSPTTATITAPVGTAVMISGTASDDVGLNSVGWQLTGSGSASGPFLTTGTWTHTFPSLAIGNYVFRVTATDTAGKPAVARTKTITITRAATPPPPTPPADDGKPETSGDIHSQKCGAGAGLATMLLLCGVVGLRSGRRRIE